LRDDEPPQHAAVLTRDVLPDRLALVVAEGNDARGLGLGEEDPPAVLGHADVAELRPALRIHAHRGAQIDLRRLEPVRAHVLPPRDELRLPLLEGALQAAILAEADVVRDPLRVVDRRHHTLLRSNSLRWPVPYTTSAPFGPTAFARWKIQFCHADSPPKLLVSSVSRPPHRTVRREDELEQRAGEARARLDEREHRARGDVEALERALEIETDLTHEPVVPVVREQPVVGLDELGPSHGPEHPDPNLRFV